MHVRIDAKPRGGLRVISDLPLHRLGRLEGYNGIGKSAAVRLLRVCVGDQPYLPREQRLWASFRAFVGTATVTMTGVVGGGTLEWHLDPELWPVTSSEPIANVGRILLDGTEVDLARVRQLVRVERVVGNEGLVPSLVRQLEPHRIAMTQAFGSSSAIRMKLEELDAILLRAQTQLERLVAPNLKDGSERVRAATQTAHAAEQAAVSARSHESALDHARRLAERLSDVRARADNLDNQVRETAQLMAAAERRLRDLDEEVAVAGRRGGAKPAAIHELELAQRNLRRVEERVQETLLICRAAAHALELAGDPMEISVPTLSSGCREELDRLNDELRSVFSAPRVAAIADQVAGVLRGAADSGLAEEVIDPGDNSHSASTVVQLLQRLSASAARLREAQPPEQAARLQARIEELARRTRLLASFGDMQRELGRRLELARNAAARLAAASETVSALSGAAVGELIAERERVTGELRDLAVQRAESLRARQELGGGMSEHELATQLHRSLSELNLTEAEMSAACGLANQAAVKAEQDASVLRARLQEATEEQEAARLHVAQAVAELAEEPGLRWLRDSVPATRKLLESSPNAAQGEASTVLGWVRRARDRGERAAKLPDQIRSVLDALGNQLSTQTGGEDSADGVTRPNFVAAQEWLGEEVSKWFSQPQIRTTLFSAGAVDVRVDLADMTVNWTVSDEQYTRPITAFSSGEQAFAYTRAQLEILDAELAVPNQIIALDEFGAFMSRDWLYRLEDYLAERAESNSADRILLILPLTRTEEEFRLSGPEGAALAEKLKAGYFVQPLADYE